MELLPEPVEAWAFIERLCTDASEVPLIVLISLIRPDRAPEGASARLCRLCREGVLVQMVDVVLRVRRGSRGLEISTYSESGTTERH